MNVGGQVKPLSAATKVAADKKRATTESVCAINFWVINIIDS
jgi:hypothetical protein